MRVWRCGMRQADSAPVSAEHRALARPSLSLHLLPRRFHLWLRRVVHRRALSFERGFHLIKAPRKFLVGLTQCRLRLEAELAREIGDGEEQVT